MNKDPKEFKCECCDYVTAIKCNFLKHIERKHKNESNDVAEVPTPNVLQQENAALKSEILSLKAEIETLKMKHQLELLQQKCDLLQSQSLQNTIVSRRTVPIKESVVEPVKESFRKKKAGENTIEYLNKFHDPTTYPIMYSEICKGLKNVKPKMSMDNINEQFAEILKPIVYSKKLMFHSGMDGRTHKIYYVNEDQEWTESLSYLNDLKFEVRENEHKNIFDLVYDRFLAVLVENTQTNMAFEDNLEYVTLYNRPYDPKQIITLLLEGMNLPDEDE